MKHEKFTHTHTFKLFLLHSAGRQRFYPCQWKESSDDIFFSPLSLIVYKLKGQPFCPRNCSVEWREWADGGGQKEIGLQNAIRCFVKVQSKGCQILWIQIWPNDHSFFFFFFFFSGGKTWWSNKKNRTSGCFWERKMKCLEMTKQILFSSLRLIISLNVPVDHA